MHLHGVKAQVTTLPFYCHGASLWGVLQPSFHVMTETGIIELSKLNVFIDA